MDNMDFDKALSEFLDDDECEQICEAIFGLIRASFIAGWNAYALCHGQEENGRGQ